MTTTQKTNWERIADGYRLGNIDITDNGKGLGSSKDSGRWAVTIAGKWVANIDTLAEAKAYAAAELRRV